VRQIRDLPKPPKHVSFDPSGALLTISCTDGKIYVYSVLNEEPQLVKTIEGEVMSLTSEELSSSKVVWHPDGRAFAIPTAENGRGHKSCLLDK